MKISFSKEISNLLYALDSNPIDRCIQCGTCSGTCPVAEFMDYSPREIIQMIRVNLKKEVLSSNTIWYCASCYHCTVKCSAGINITEMMYALKRYSIWKNYYKKSLIGPNFSKLFIRQILKTGKSFEPSLAPSFIFKYGFRSFLDDSLMGFTLWRKGRMAVIPSKIKRIENFKRVIARIIPLGRST